MSEQKTPSLKLAIATTAQYYGDHPIRSLFHISIALLTAGVYSFWFGFVVLYTWTGPAEDSRIGKYMEERGVGEYVSKNNKPTAAAKQAAEKAGSGIKGAADESQVNSRTALDQTPTLFDSLSAVFVSYIRLFREKKAIFILHLILTIVTGGLFLLWYPIVWIDTWNGGPRGPRSKEELINRGYEFEEQSNQ